MTLTGRGHVAVDLERAFDAIDARIVGNAQVTTHDQIDSDRLNEVRGPVQSFQQNVYSLGAEIDSAPHHEVRLSAGMSYDLAATARTGGRDAQDEFSSWSANVAARWYPADRWQIVGTLGRRTRFPSLRERKEKLWESLCSIRTFNRKR